MYIYNLYRRHPVIISSLIITIFKGNDFNLYIYIYTPFKVDSFTYFTTEVIWNKRRLCRLQSMEFPDGYHFTPQLYKIESRSAMLCLYFLKRSYSIVTYFASELKVVSGSMFSFVRHHHWRYAKV